MPLRHLARFAGVALIIACLSPRSALASDPIQLPNGLAITPDAAPRSVVTPLNPGMPGRPDVTLSQAVTTSLSPDGKTLLVLTSGYNREGRQSFDEYVLVFDVAAYPPRQTQALAVPNTFCGLAWNPDGGEFYVSGGVDDRLYVFATRGSAGRFARAGAIALGHPRGNGLLSNAPAPMNESAPKPMVAGVAVNRSGTLAIAANFYNDSISLVDLKTRKKTAELDLRPGVEDRAKSGTPGGEFPYWVAIRGDDTAYVSSPRDREIDVVSLGAEPSVAARIRVPGQPNRLILNRAQDRLFVALDNADAVAVVDVAANRLLRTFAVVAPARLLGAGALPHGANPNSLALSPDERTLYVTDGGTNAVAVVGLRADGSGEVTGLIPTGWYPSSVSADEGHLYIVNAKSVPGPNVGNCRGDVQAPDVADCGKTPNQYVYNLEKASLLSLPLPPSAELDALTERVAANNHFDRLRSPADPVIAELARRIRHIVYIIKENRTYDQVLGDLEVGNGDPALVEFPEPLTPNHHALARRFVTLDNFLDSGEVSGVGWNWTTAARTTDYTEKTVPPNYAGRGFMYDWEGTNRGVNVGIASMADRVKAQPLLQADPRRRPTPICSPAAPTSPRPIRSRARRAPATSGTKRWRRAARCATTASTATSHATRTRTPTAAICRFRRRRSPTSVSRRYRRRHRSPRAPIRTSGASIRTTPTSTTTRSGRASSTRSSRMGTCPICHSSASRTITSAASARPGTASTLPGCRWPTTTTPSGWSSRRSRTVRTRTARSSSSSRTTRRTARITWTLTGASRTSSVPT